MFREQTFGNKKKLSLPPKNLGIELEIAYKISKKIFAAKIEKKTQLKNYIYGVAPAIELVGCRQKLKKIDHVGQAIVDFGLNISFVRSKMYKTKDILNLNLKTKVTNLKNKKVYLGAFKKCHGKPNKCIILAVSGVKKKRCFT